MVAGRTSIGRDSRRRPCLHLLVLVALVSSAIPISPNPCAGPLCHNPRALLATHVRCRPASPSEPIYGSPCARAACSPAPPPHHLAENLVPTNVLHAHVPSPFDMPMSFPNVKTVCGADPYGILKQNEQTFAKTISKFQKMTSGHLPDP